ncbi:MAG: MMPL family transporter [Desulfobacterales bacterium]|nr:MMPL family transporter [Desulfobacterales bacterium]
MFNDYFSRFSDSIHQRKWLVAGLVGIIVTTAAIGLRFVSFDSNIELMLPGNDEVHRSIRFLRESHFSDKVVLSFELASSEHTTRDLILAVDRLAESLKPPMVTDVVSGVAGNNMVEGMLSFLKYTPQLLDEQALSLIKQQITPAGVKESLRRNYRQLLIPASTFMMPFIRSDPLGVKSGVLGSLQKLSSSLGYDVRIEEGHFVSRDGKHAMLILETPVVLTDGFGSRRLISYLRKKLEGLPPFISGDIIAGHLHTISNEDVMKRDIRLTLTIASVAFLCLFVFVFRDIKAVMVFLLPLLSVLVSINLSSLMLKELSYFIIGMGGVIAGIAVDYAIHVYMAVRARGGRADAVKDVAKPVVIGALTTISVFAAFFFSSVQGYHQLAFFSILSIVLCLAGALFILPHFLGCGAYDRFPGMIQGSRLKAQGSRLKAESRNLLGFSFQLSTQMPDTIRVACWGMVMVTAVILSCRVTFNSDISQLDGSEPEIIQAEQKFHLVWGGEDKPAVFVVPGKTLEEALLQNERIYREATAEVGEDNFSSFAVIWPSKQTRNSNAMRWKAFWKQGKEAKLKKLLREHGPAYHFSEDAFSPFFEHLYAGTVVQGEPEGLSFFETLKERFVLKKQNGYQVLSFFPDEDQYVTALTAVSSGYPGTFLVSRKTLSRALSQSVSSEIVLLSGIAALFIPAMTCLLLKDIRLAALALVPVVTGIMVVLGMMSVLALSVNAPSVIAAMVVVGLCIDYGIFMVYTCRYDLRTGTRMAVTLSALTTLIGAGVLLFAKHPVLFSIGITLVTGVSVGYVASLIVVPALYRLWLKNA